MIDLPISVLITLILTGFGKKLFRQVLPNVSLSFLENVVVSFALGAGTTALLVLAIGLAGFLYKWALVALLLGFCLFARKGIAELLFNLRAWLSAALRADLSAFERFLLGALVFVGFFTLIGALSPILGMDSVSYHMQNVKIFIQNHRVAAIPYTRESLWPFLVQMLFALGLCLKGIALAKLFHFTFYVAAILSIYVLCRKYRPRPNALLAATIFALTPAIFTGATYAYTDLAVVFYTVMAFYGFFSWLDSSSTRWFCFSGLMSGFLLGIKITSAIVPVLILVLYANRIFLLSMKPRKKLVPGLIFIASMVAVCGVWYVRSWIILGNPIYPFAAYLFGGAGYPENFLRYQTTSGIGTGILPFIIMLWPLTLDPNRFGGESIGFLFLVFLPMLVFVRKHDRFFKYSLVIALCLYASWFIVYQYTRFFYPTLVFLSILASYAYYDFCPGDLLLRRIASFVLLGGALYGSALSVYHNADKLPVVFSLKSGKEYLLKHERSFEIADYVNTHVPKNAKILLLSEARLYYFERDVAQADMILSEYLSGKQRKPGQTMEKCIREAGYGDYVVSMRDLSKNAPKEQAEFAKKLFSKHAKQVLRKIEFVYRDERYAYELWKITDPFGDPS